MPLPNHTLLIIAAVPLAAHAVAPGQGLVQGDLSILRSRQWSN